MSNQSNPTAGDQVSRKSIKKSKPIALIIAGMHRSGTSALSRVINLLGADLPPDLMNPAEDNKSGFWESIKLSKIHDKLLDSLDSRWDSVTPIPSDFYKSIIIEEYHEDILCFLQENFKNSRFFAIKDPRICRLIPVWIKVLQDFNAEARFIIPFRNPLEVANSLRRRNNFSTSKSLLLWLRYILEAEQYTRNQHRSFITYETLLTNWYAIAEKIETDLNFTWPRKSLNARLDIERFLSPDFRHHHVRDDFLQSTAQVAGWVLETYEALQELIPNAHKAASLEKLDTVNNDIQTADTIYGMVLVDHQSEMTALRKIFELN